MKSDDISPQGAAAIAPTDLSAVTVVVCATCRDVSGSDAHPRAGAVLGGGDVDVMTAVMLNAEVSIAD